MAQNKNALIRYKTIDKCLQNPYRNWTLEDLIDACSDALSDYENRKISISKRTIQGDIQVMRSDKLGYNAPIEVYDKRYYRYSEPDFTITDIPLTDMDMNVLSETVEMLKQFKEFSLFSELGGIINRLEDKIYTEKNNSAAVIHLEKNENLLGLEHLDFIYQAIIKGIVLEIKYKSFKAKRPSILDFHPYILKEYNNRWFLIGRKHGEKTTLTFALDRIEKLDYNLKIDYDNRNFNADDYYKNTIGVTVFNDNHLEETELLITKSNAPYVLTKPFHHSQKTIETYENGDIRIRLLVDLNYEFERLLLGFGDSLKVLKPRRLKSRIKAIHRKAYESYRPLNSGT